MTPMVETIAKALYERWVNYPACDASKSWEHRAKEMPASAEIFRGHAVTVLDAMRKPSAEMLEAARREHGFDLYTYMAMIDAAIAEAKL